MTTANQLIANFRPDPGNIEFNQALKFVMQTNRSLFLTGKAGTGKTTFLHYLRQICPKNIAVVAPTGIAAINAGGQTIHSFFQLNFRNIYMPGDPRFSEQVRATECGNTNIYEHLRYKEARVKMLNSLDVLIIDEISMVPPYLLDTIDRILRVFRKRRYESFGGVQLLMLGDLFQLPPVAADPDVRNEALRHYPSMLPLHARVFKHNPPVNIELKRIYRQKDASFIDILNRVRMAYHTRTDLEYINMRVLSKIVRQKKMEDTQTGWFQTRNGVIDTEAQNNSLLDHWMKSKPEAIQPEDGVIQLTTNNRQADYINQQKYDAIDAPETEYMAEIRGDFKHNEYPTNEFLNLKVGTQVMVIRNDGLMGTYNGMIGIVVALHPDTVRIDVDGTFLAVSRVQWESVRYKVNRNGMLEPEVVGTFTQFPLRYAWAITIHKSQGMTFQRAHMHLSGAFATGQVYVALSRCTSLEGITLQTPVQYHNIVADPVAIDFHNRTASNEQLEAMLPDDAANYQYIQARELFKKGRYEESFEAFRMAMAHRNDMDNPDFKRWVLVLLRRYGPGILELDGVTIDTETVNPEQLLSNVA
jgi:ATP-dependent exoDNAse (exonuclease V) alpha subunit